MRVTTFPLHVLGENLSHLEMGIRRAAAHIAGGRFPHVVSWRDPFTGLYGWLRNHRGGYPLWEQGSTFGRPDPHRFGAQGARCRSECATGAESRPAAASPLPGAATPESTTAVRTVRHPLGPALNGAGAPGPRDQVLCGSLIALETGDHAWAHAEKYFCTIVVLTTDCSFDSSKKSLVAIAAPGPLLCALRPARERPPETL